MMSIPKPANIERKIALARGALGFERLWAALHWPLLLLLAFAAVVIGGALPLLPSWPKLIVLALFGVALLWTLRPLARLNRPTRHEAMRRVEAKTGLPHRPVSGHRDRLAAGIEDPLQQAIWEEHKLRQLRGLEHLKAGVPQSAWRDIDPRAFRVPVALALLAALVLGPGDTRSNLADSFAFTPKVAAIPLVMDAWLKPPAYTGKPPVLLTSPAMAERLKTEPDILVPEKAVLTLRITGAREPKLSFHELNEPGAAAPEVEGFAPKTKNADGVFQSETPIARPALVKVTDGAALLGQWRIALIPDAPPIIAITEEPKGDSSGTLSVPWKAGDDYGMTGIAADIYLADEQDDGTGFSGDGIFEFEPPKFAVSLRKAQPREETGTSKGDVAEHPWAGFMVEMTLTAKDAAGQTAASEKKTFRLPERLFTRPLARALIEQRKHLILAPEESGGVEQMLDALLTYPEGLIEGSGTHIAIAAVMSRLRASETRADIDTVISSLWQIAVGIEEGTLSNAKAELEALRKELERALREGASPERIAELTGKLRQALDRYLQSLLEESQKRMAQGNQNPGQQQQGKMVSPQDLQKMLDMIEKLARSGANEAAQEMLSQLEDILRNLQPGMAQQQQGSPQDSPLGQMLDQLSEMLRQQQKLMDETQRMPQDGSGMEQAPGQQGEGRQGMSGLGDRQQGIGQMLKELMEQFGRNSMEAPQSFGEAGKSMQGAEGSLRDGNRDQALGDQGDAMAKLREGAQGLARQMMQQGQGQQGNQGRTGEARGDDRDPLGRPLPNRGEDYGPDRNMLPSELAIQRAREILDLLRSRAGEQQLPRLDRDYIERLLRGLY